MKKILLVLIILLSIYSVSATTWYVDNNVASSGTGQSWTSAWKNIVNINWANVHAGDTIYISGGVINQTYPQVYNSYLNYFQNAQITGGYVTLTKGIEANHNGEVIFELRGNPANPGYAFSIGSSSGIRLYNLTFISTTNDTVTTAPVCLSIHDSTNIIVDHCRMISNGNAFGLIIDNTDFFVVNNSYIRIMPNNYTMRNTMDPLYFQYGRGGNIITNNYIMDQGVGGDHIDDIQGLYFGDNGNYLTVIEGNMFYYYMPGQTGGMHGIYLSSLNNNRIRIANNIFVDDFVQAGYHQIAINPVNSTYNVNVSIINNTLVTGFSQINPMVINPRVKSLTIRNNHVLEAGGNIRAINIYPDGSINDIPYKDIDYNKYYSTGGTVTFWDAITGSKTFQQWQAMGLDAHSVDEEFSVMNLWGPNPEDYRIVGENCSPADTNCDDCISLAEISAYVGKWLNGQGVTLGEVSAAVSIWLGGC